jgi:hypothetical protein
MAAGDTDLAADGRKDWGWSIPVNHTFKKGGMVINSWTKQGKICG